MDPSHIVVIGTSPFAADGAPGIVALVTLVVAGFVAVAAIGLVIALTAVRLAAFGREGVFSHES